MKLMVSRTGPETVRVITREPYVFKIGGYDMKQFPKKLVEVCDHKDVSLTVPVDNYLTLRKVS